MKAKQSSDTCVAGWKHMGLTGFLSLLLVFQVLCAATRADQNPLGIQGIYVLSGPSIESTRNANKPFVDGFAWRLKWKDLDQGILAPRYDFSLVDTAIAALQAMNKKLTMALFVQEVPRYVLQSAKDTFQTIVPGIGDTTYSVLAPVPWDEPAIHHYRNLARALAGHPVYDAISRTRVPLRDHPALAGLRVCVIGTHGLSDRDHTIVNLPSYTREKFVNGLLENLHAVQDEFPSTPTWFEYKSIRDHTRKPSLDSVVLDVIASEFDGVRNPRMGLFIEYLRGDAPKPETVVGMNLLTHRANGGSTLFQACGPWCTHGLCDFKQGDDSPENGLELGYNTYGSVYYEMYNADLEYEPFRPVFEEWHRFLHRLPK